VLLDPRGHIARYYFGLQYDTVALRGAVQAASVQAAPSWTQPLQLLCYCLVDLTGRYDTRVLALLRLTCLSVALCGAVWLWRSLASTTRRARA
jgi:hypothetical protein